MADLPSSTSGLVGLLLFSIFNNRTQTQGLVNAHKQPTSWVIVQHQTEWVYDKWLQSQIWILPIPEAAQRSQPLGLNTPRYWVDLMLSCIHELMTVICLLLSLLKVLLDFLRVSPKISEKKKKCFSSSFPFIKDLFLLCVW